MLSLSRYVDRIKEIVRTGWLEAGIRDGETVAEHMYHSALIATVFEHVSGDTEVNWNLVKTYCLIHDLGEAIVGDIPAPQKTDRDRMMEAEALSKILSGYGFPEIDLDRLDTPEKIIYKASEQLATLLQAIIYWERGYRNGKVLEIMMSSWRNFMDLAKASGKPWLNKIVDELGAIIDGYSNTV